MELHNKESDFKFELGKELFIENTQDGRIKVLMLLDVKNNESVAFFYDSLEEFNKSWEDYRPAEALATKKKRLKAWAEENDVDSVFVELFYYADCVRFTKIGGNESITIKAWPQAGLVHRLPYTLGDLLKTGEEEE